MVQAVLQLARALGLEVVAEGIETAEQLDRLRGLRCVAGQGYHLAPPMTATDFEDLLRSYREGRAIISA
jgi:EAL domain-containing protein (putative c-di-GMP-specific phosphodiesterase class I)